MATKLPGAKIITFLVLAILATWCRAEEKWFMPPTIEPDYFGPDLQFFAPAEIDDYGGKQYAKTGFFLTGERLFINQSRPEDVPPDNLGFPQLGDPGTTPAPLNGQFGSFDGDWTWGNRIEGGYMTQDDHGWLGSITWITGPNAAYIMPQQSLEGFIGGVDNAPAIPNIPSIIGLEQSLNKSSTTSVELNKTWRCDPFHNGTVLEPMVGVRYVRFIDYFKHDIYGRFDSDLFTGFPDFFAPNVNGNYEIIKTRQADFDNMMLGGQLGFRLSRQYGHWSFSGSVRGFGMQNWQFLSIYQRQTTYRYDPLPPPGPLPVVLFPNPRIETSYNQDKPVFVDNHEFVWGGEYRGELGYAITRDLNLQFGVTVMHFGRGVGRGGSLVGSDQDLIMAGINMGVVLNR